MQDYETVTTALTVSDTTYGLRLKASCAEIEMGAASAMRPRAESAAARSEPCRFRSR